jgi:hypothetical protein
MGGRYTLTIEKSVKIAEKAQTTDKASVDAREPPQMKSSATGRVRPQLARGFRQAAGRNDLPRCSGRAGYLEQCPAKSVHAS